MGKQKEEATGEGWQDSIRIRERLMFPSPFCPRLLPQAQSRYSSNPWGGRSALTFTSRPSLGGDERQASRPTNACQLHKIARHNGDIAPRQFCDPRLAKASHIADFAFLLLPFIVPAISRGLAENPLVRALRFFFQGGGARSFSRCLCTTALACNLTVFPLVRSVQPNAIHTGWSCPGLLESDIIPILCL